MTERLEAERFARRLDLQSGRRVMYVANGRCVTVRKACNRLRRWARARWP